MPRLLSRFALAPIGIIALALASACSSGSPGGPSETLSITAQPRSQTIAPGGSATLAVSAAGSSAITYQWFVGAAGDTSSPIQNATAAEYTTPALLTTTRYWVRVGRAVDSETATITVDSSTESPRPPVIMEQPEDETIAPGQKATIFVEVTGSAPFAYQWFRGARGDTGNPVAGATSTHYTTPELNETTRYWVRVSNAIGSTDSQTATITVSVPPAPAPPAPPPPPAPTPPSPSPSPSPTPPPAPPTPDPSAAAFENEVVTLVNQRRAAGATCGGTAYPPVAPLTMNANLRLAAQLHSQDMATNNYFSHTSLDGRTFVDRIRAAGYTGSNPLGENIAAGQGSPASVVNGWMGSTGHCQNIMNGSYRAVGMGYSFRAGSPFGSYWTQTFGGS